MKASPAQQLIAQHEAGMHDIKSNGACKACQKEIQEMAKQKVQCDCGGSYDGTPSGKAKHDGTVKHQDYVAGLISLLPEAPANVSAKERATVAAQPVATPEPAKISERSLEGRLDALIVEKSRERDRRVVDHKWRVANRPTEADAYFASKVKPLVDEIALLKEAASALVK